MNLRRAWKYRIYPSKNQEKELGGCLHRCGMLWNSLLGYTKEYYENAGEFPTKAQLCTRTKETGLFSQVAQNVADRIVKSLKGMIARKKAGMKAGFPRFRPVERTKSFTYPQFGFRLADRLELSGVGNISIRKHRSMQGKIKTLTIKRTPSDKWYAIFTTEMEADVPQKKDGPEAGIDLGIENFAFLSDGEVVENPRHILWAEERLKKAQKQLSAKTKGGRNRRKARLKVAVCHEKLADKRRDFLHKTSRKLVEKYSFLALENLNVADMSRGFLAKHVLDCSWAEFVGMLRYKAESAGCEVVLVNPAHTSQRCSNCGLVQKKPLAERWHECQCGTSMHRDLNAAINILGRATHGRWGSNARGEDCVSILKEAGSPGL